MSLDGGIESVPLNVSLSNAWSVCLFGAVFKHHVIIKEISKKCKKTANLNLSFFSFPMRAVHFFHCI